MGGILSGNDEFEENSYYQPEGNNSIKQTIKCTIPSVIKNYRIEDSDKVSWKQTHFILAIDSGCILGIE